MVKRNTIEFTPEGHEILSQKPIEIPLGFERPLTLQEEIRIMIQSEASRAAEAAGFETFEESDDFEVDDEDDDQLSSPYEILEMIPDGPTANEIDGSAPDSSGPQVGTAPPTDGKNPPVGNGENQIAAGTAEPGRGNNGTPGSDAASPVDPLTRRE